MLKKLLLTISMLALVALLPFFACCASNGQEHSLTYINEKAPTCSENGNIGYWHCSDCDKFFSDAEGLYEITDAASVILKKTEHTFGDWSHDDLYHWHQCTACGFVKDKEQHVGENNVCTLCKGKTATAGLEYKLSGNSYEVSGIGLVSDPDIVIPGTYNGLPVSGIAEKAFISCNTVTSISLPDSIQTIGPFSFFKCAALKEIDLGNGVQRIADNAFGECINLTKIELPQSLLHIGNYSFTACENLLQIELPQSLQTLGENAFYECGKLVIFCEPSSLPYEWCNPSNTCPVIWDCKNNDVADNGMTFVTIDNLRYSLYEGYAGLYKQTHTLQGEIEIPSEIVYQDQTYPVKTILREAFRGCGMLTSIFIPGTVSTFEEYAFWGCVNLAEVHIGDLSAWCTAQFQNSLSNPLLYANLYIDNNAVTSITVPDGTSCIGDYAFSEYASLTDIFIPDSVTRIGDHAFFNCRQLQDVVFSNSLNSIGIAAFYHCNLSKISIPKNVTAIGENAFSDCGVSPQTHIEDLAAWCAIQFDNYNANPLSCGGDLYVNGEPITKLILPENLRSIGNFAFAGANKIAELTIPKTLLSIGVGAFYDCDALKSVSVGDIATWCSLSFANAKSNPIYYARNLYMDGELITDLTVPASVKEIGTYTFSNCVNLLSVTIENGVESIGDFAFYGCINLTSVTIPKSVTDIGKKLFFDVYSSKMQRIAFEDAHGWSVFNSADESEAISVDVSDPENNVVLFFYDYANFYWKKA